MTVLAPGYVQPVESAEELKHLGVSWKVLVSSATSDGTLLMAQATFPEGSAPPVHRHNREDESWYVLSGSARFHLDGVTSEVGPGTAVWGPRGQSHTFEILEEGTQLLVVVTVGANFEGFLRATAGEVPPSIDVLLAEMAKIDADFLAPPPGH